MTQFHQRMALGAEQEPSSFSRPLHTFIYIHDLRTHWISGHRRFGPLLLITRLTSRLTSQDNLGGMRRDQDDTETLSYESEGLVGKKEIRAAVIDVFEQCRLHQTGVRTIIRHTI
jgi:hypothetical protein